MQLGDGVRREDERRPDTSHVVSLIVPIRNEQKHIADCLRSIRQQTYPAELLEIIVVDGDSADETLRLVQEEAAVDPRVHVIANPAQVMPVGFNLGVRQATGAYIGQVSGHSVLPEDYVASAVDAIQRTGAWSVGGRILRRASTPMQHAIALATSSPIGVGDSTHNYATRAGWVDTVFPGFWRRDVFDRIGLLDPFMVVNEDNELSLRIRRAGGGIWYDPAIGVEYIPRSSLGALFHQYRRYALGKMRVLRKHRAGITWRHVVPAACLAFVILAGLVALVVPELRWFWLAAVILYLGVLVVAGIRLRTSATTWWRITAAIAVLHTAYGIGTWQGLATWSSRSH